MRRNFALLSIVLTTQFASLGCVTEKEKPKKEAVKATTFELDALPADAQKAGVDFDGKVTLLGYKTAVKGAVRDGQKITYTLYWQATKPLSSKGWQLFTHVLDDKKKRALNLDRVGPMREADISPNDWKPGKVYADEQTFTVPKGLKGSQLQVSVGLWKGEERLPILNGPQLGDNRGLALSYELKADATPKSEVPSLRVDRLPANTVLKIDGKLDEEAWKSAASTGAFVDMKAGKVTPDAAVQGSARVLWDKDGLYIGFEVQDRDIIGGFPKTAVDPHLWTKDTVEIMVDPDGDGDNKDYYEIQVNPQNLVFDSQFDAYNAPKGGENGPFGHQDWSAKLTSAVFVDGTLDKAGDKDKGYTVEIKLPWSSFSKAKKSPPELGSEWRINLYAMQDNGGVGWSPILGQGNFHKATRFGRVLFAEKGWQPGAAASEPSTSLAVAPVPVAPGIVNPAVKLPATVGAVAPVAQPVSPVAPKPSTPGVVATPPAVKPATPAAPVVPATPAPQPPAAAKTAAAP